MELPRPFFFFFLLHYIADVKAGNIDWEFTSFLILGFFNIPEMCNLRSYFLSQKQSGFHCLYPLGDSTFKIECRFNVI